jgi:hypothetical protein
LTLREARAVVLRMRRQIQELEWRNKHVPSDPRSRAALGTLHRLQDELFGIGG